MIFHLFYLIIWMRRSLKDPNYPCQFFTVRYISISCIVMMKHYILGTSRDYNQGTTYFWDIAKNLHQWLNQVTCLISIHAWHLHNLHGPFIIPFLYQGAYNLYKYLQNYSQRSYYTPSNRTDDGWEWLLRQSQMLKASSDNRLVWCTTMLITTRWA
jgi:hypothetical protein